MAELKLKEDVAMYVMYPESSISPTSLHQLFF